jgi:hypothetical protein
MTTKDGVEVEEFTEDPEEESTGLEPGEPSRWI